ncbi:Histidine phosphatase superfamily (branch 1) [Novymonas esmeraldas]|uniref:Histidine phosphatase superfamily (Branch 1) n=1 Tax=Novymonas esmeraldas TaxID=1808958 RepID=A0AAW0EVS0_9TRYP
MPPAHIFIARHSERVDHMDAEFGKTYSRPHDSPITDNGVTFAEKLGDYLVHHYGVRPSEVVFLSSPLTRCVQTSHGIVTGILRSAAGTSPDTIPIYIEPAVMEGPYWMFYDMSKNVAVVEPNGGPFHCPEPVYHDAAFHHASTSRHVQLHNPFPLHPAPHFAVEDNKLTDASFPERCARGAQTLLTIPELDGKTVVLVAHGETVWRALHALKGTTMESEIHSPAYTGFVHVTCSGEGGAETQVRVEFEPFATPHLSETPKETSGVSA